MPAKTRKADRKNAFCLIFERDFVDESEVKTAFDRYINNFATEANEELDKKFVYQLFSGTFNCISEIDSLIKENAENWTFERISKVDLAILRMAVFEIKFMKNGNAKIAINEAVELAKRFSSDNSPKFINGVLGNILRDAENEAKSV